MRLLRARTGQAAREELLAREKEHTRLGDELARQRRELPWVRVEKEYRFDTDDGTQHAGGAVRRPLQLLVYHFMFGPSYEAGCPTCSSMADGVNGVAPAPERPRRDHAVRLAGAAREAAGVQAADGLELPLGLVGRQRLQLRPRLLQQRGADARVGRADARAAAADRRPQRERESGTDVVGYLTESFGFSAFALDDGAVYQTYSTTGRGVEFLMGYYPILDRAPKGRDEGDGFQTLDPPPRRVRRMTGHPGGDQRNRQE